MNTTNTTGGAARVTGLTCPTCRVRMRTRKTVHRADGSVQRAKRCPACGHRAVTFERVRRAEPAWVQNPCQVPPPGA